MSSGLEKCTAMNRLCDFVEASIALAIDQVSQLPTSVLALDGMSSGKGRCLLNNLCRRPGTRYLEVGVWAGSTLISALYGNSESVVAAEAIDNFSQFGGPREVFEQKTREFLGEGRFTLHVNGYREVAPTLQPPVNVYFYDGEHSAENQRDGLLHFWPCLADEFVFLVDDWNWPCVKQGTYEGIAKSGGRMVKSWELPAAFNGDREQWWNGLFVAVMQK